ncbi:MAG: anti-sigma factor antagonist [Actinobacteria bacterium]|jgi:anti-anti-sigma factor|nr:anti-sigma factor antagonist [Actinomycetota bacterium]
MNDSPLEILVQAAEGTTTVTIRGDASASRSGELEDGIRPLLDGPPGRIEVELAGMTFLSSTGLAVLVRLSRIARQSKREFRLLQPPAHIERMLRIANLPIG